MFILYTCFIIEITHELLKCKDVPKKSTEAVGKNISCELTLQRLSLLTFGWLSFQPMFAT